MEESKLFEIFKLNDEELETLIKELDEQEKEELIKFLIMFSKKMNQLYISYIKAQDIVVQTQDLSIKQSDLMIDNLLDRLNKEKIDILNKEDIIRIFGWEDQKARAFLKMAMQMKYATKINKNIVITKNNFEKYLEFLRGQDLSI